MSSSAWPAVVAALGSSGLTGFFTFGIQERQRRREARVGRLAERRRIYRELMDAAMEITNALWDIRIAGDEPSAIYEYAKRPMRRYQQANADAMLTFDPDEILAIRRLADAVTAFDLAEEGARERLAQARRTFALFARPRIGEAAISWPAESP